MVDFEEIVDPKPLNSAGENRPPKEETSIEAKPSESIVQVIETLKKVAEPSPEKKKNSSKPKHQKKSPQKKAASRKGSPKKRVAKQKMTPKKIPIIPEAQEIPKRRLIPTSFTNLIIFTIIFSVLVAAQVAIMHIERQQKIPLRVAPIQITAEEPVDSFEVNSGEVVKLESGEPENVEVKEEVVKSGSVEVDSLEVQREEDVVEVVKEPREEIIAEKEVEEKIEEKVIPKPVEKTVVKKKARRSRSTYYRPDPYTNSSPLDLDGVAAREHYKAGNVVLVPAAPGASSTSIKTVKRSVEPPSQPVERSYDTIEVKNLREGSYSDTRNPWNSGGSMDLDDPSNFSKHSKETAKRRR